MCIAKTTGNTPGYKERRLSDLLSLEIKLGKIGKKDEKKTWAEIYVALKSEQWI